MRVSDCFIELIAYVSYAIPHAETKQVSSEKIREDILRLITQSKVLAEKGDISHSDYDLSCFAVFVWIDETIMQSSWQGKVKWQKDLLQRRFYKTTGGGVEFYNKLEKLEPYENEVREVYYLCLVSGYSGRYGTTGEDVFIRDGLKASNLKRLTGTSDGISSLESDLLFPGSYQPEDLAGYTVKNNNKGRFLLSGLLGLGPVVVFGFLFVLYHFILNNQMITRLVP